MRIDIITSLPDIFPPLIAIGNIGRAVAKDIVKINIYNLREFSDDPHKSIDDYPYGGGPGMILKAGPIFKAIKYVKNSIESTEVTVVYLTPQGEKFTQKKANELSKRKNIIFLCGRFKGIDQRIRESLVDEEISIGDYVLSGGELPALVVIDSIVRLIPGVIGSKESADSDSFQEGYFDCSYYTRPEIFNGLEVPEVLLSGNHAKIEEWRKKNALANTYKKRKDLLYKKSLPVKEKG